MLPRCMTSRSPRSSRERTRIAYTHLRLATAWLIRESHPKPRLRLLGMSTASKRPLHIGGRGLLDTGVRTRIDS